MPFWKPQALGAKNNMKRANKTRLKISIRLSVASKKLVKRGLNKAILTLNWPVVASGDTTSQIYTVGLQIVKRKRKQTKRLKALISKVGWILFGVLADFFVHYFLLKILS